VATEGNNRKRIKVFYYIPSLVQGGTERQVLALISSLPDDFEPILCLQENRIFYSDLLPEGQPKYCLETRRMNIRSLFRLKGFIEQEKPHILHSFRDRGNSWARVAGIMAHVPVVISSCRNRAMNPRHLLMERLLSDRADAVLTNSEGVKTDLVRFARVRKEKIFVIPNILDVEYFREPTEDERKAARLHYGFEDKTFVFSVPGRISFQKNQLGLVIAVALTLVTGKAKCPWLVVFAGRRRDKAIANMFDAVRSERHIAKTVRFVGEEHDVRRLYFASDCVVVPSLYEGMSNTVLEACACGVPTIVSHAANMDGIVLDQVTGFEVQPLNIFGLSNAMLRMMSLSQAQRSEMGRLARERVLKEIVKGRDYSSQQVVKVYRELLQRKGIEV
jgi:glycosyltransferase involved in cell wall biosynthesis